MQSVEGMKVVCHELAAATNDPEGSLMEDLIKDADKLVSCLAAKVIVSPIDLISSISHFLYSISFDFLFSFFRLQRLLTLA